MKRERPEPTKPDPPPLNKGWRIVFILWALMFATLVLYEVGGFLWWMLRKLF